MYNLKGILELIETDENQVIIKVNASDPLTVARYPFLNSDMKYITVTRGKKHIFAVIDKEGKTWGFHFGAGGYTLIDDLSCLLKENVMKFIKDNMIIIDYDGGEPQNAKVFYNSYREQWQLLIETDEDGFPYFSDTAQNHEEAIREFVGIVDADIWVKNERDIWKAINPKFTLK